MKVATHKIPIFNGAIKIICIGAEDKDKDLIETIYQENPEIAETLNSHTDETLYAHTLSQFDNKEYATNKITTVVIFNFLNQSIIPLSVIVHEAVHVATGILHRCGVPISYKNDEVLAYMTDWAFDLLYSETSELLSSQFHSKAGGD